MPTVSVIVPVYKVEPYLRKCVDSVLAQSFADFELILVDDGSPDTCGAICDEYAAQDARVRVIHKENAGLSSARNAGLAVAQGEFVCFVDSDDFVDPVLLENAVREIAGFDSVAWGYRDIDENGELLLDSRRLSADYRWEDEAALFDFFMRSFFSYKIGWEAWDRLYRKSIIDRCGLFFEDNRVIFAEDVYFNILYLLHSRSVRCLDAVYYNHLVRSGSIMREQWHRYNFGRMTELAKAVDRHLAEQEDMPLMRDKSSVLFYEILNHVLPRARENDPTLDVRRIRRILYDEVRDIAFFQEKCAQLQRHRRDLELGHGHIGALEIEAEFRYYLDGSYGAYCLRQGGIGVLRLVRSAMTAPDAARSPRG